jgi:hypothetical protein
MSERRAAGAVDLRPMRDDPPPFLRAWPRVYRAVLIYLALLVSALYVITRVFAA